MNSLKEAIARRFSVKKKFIKRFLKNEFVKENARAGVFF